MKIEEIPDEISESEILGEAMGWLFLEDFIESFPDSEVKNKILSLMNDRRMELLGMEL